MNIWDITFREGEPVKVAFRDSETEVQYIFRWKGDEGIYVDDPERGKVLFIPWTSIEYLAWEEKEEEKK